MSAVMGYAIQGQGHLEYIALLLGHLDNALEQVIDGFMAV